MDKCGAHWRAALALCVNERSSLQFNAHKVLICSDQPPFLPRRLGTLPYELRTVVVAEFNNGQETGLDISSEVFGIWIACVSLLEIKDA